MRSASRGRRARRSATRSWTPIAVLAILAFAALASPARPDDPLEAYRALARSPAHERLLEVARDAMDRYFDSALATRPPGDLDWPGAPVGIYVTLFEGSRMRACVGSASPPGATMSEAIRTLAVLTLVADRRRPPVRHDELSGLRVAIAFAGPPVPVADPMLVQPAREGLLITSPAGTVAYLPGEARTVSWALRDARRSGLLTGRPQDAGYERFPVVMIREPARATAKESDED